jgi:hypothetical protein
MWVYEIKIKPARRDFRRKSPFNESAAQSEPPDSDILILFLDLLRVCLIRAGYNYNFAMVGLFGNPLYA